MQYDIPQESELTWLWCHGERAEAIANPCFIYCSYCTYITYHRVVFLQINGPIKSTCYCFPVKLHGCCTYRVLEQVLKMYIMYMVKNELSSFRARINYNRSLYICILPVSLNAVHLSNGANYTPLLV